MYDIADQVRTWLAQGRPVHVALVVATRGFSSRDQSAALAWTAGEPPAGSLGVPVTPPESPGLVELVVSDAEAAGVGLSCGGAASVLVLSAAALPDELWTRLAAREPLCLVTEVDTLDTAVLTPDTVRDAHGFADEIPRLFGRGTSTTALLGRSAVAALWPVPSLVVVGDGLIATALTDTAALLGWTTRTTSEVDDAVSAVTGLHRSDAVVVLSHDRAVDGPVLRAALGSAAGYVGALGSRRTQAARREWLTADGVAGADIDRIHGPAGLDIDAHTPGEIAISIVAEVLGSRSSAGGGALRDRPGPVHVAGVRTPPPRYASSD